MTATGTIYVEDISSQLLTYTSIRVYRDTSPVGAFSTLATTLTLVAAQEEYPFTDSGGTVNTLWRCTFYNMGTTAESGLGELIRPSATTLRRLRMEAARQAGAGFDGACSGAGSSTTLVDLALRDSGIDSAFLEGGWIYRPDAALPGDRVRRVKKDGFDSTTGTVSFDRAYGNSPASAEVYQMFNFFPPIDQAGVAYSWDRAVREGLGAAWFIDQLNIGQGTATRDNRFSLAAFPDVTARTWRRVLLRTVDVNGFISDTSAHTNGRYVVPVTNATDFALDIFPAPTPLQTVLVEAVRVDDGLYSDSDVTSCPARLAVRAAVLKAYSRLQMLHPGKYGGEYAVALADWQEEQSRQYPQDMVLGL